MAVSLHVFTRIFLVTNLSNRDKSASVARCLTRHNWTLNCTALTSSTEHGRSSHIASERTYRKQHLHHLFHCCVTSPRMRKPLALHINGCCLQPPLKNGSLGHSSIKIYIRFRRVTLHSVCVQQGNDSFEISLDGPFRRSMSLWKKI
jgi:hypothetical protein